MKNKLILITAIAAALAPMAAMSDANIYGQLRYSFSSADADTGAGSTLSGNDNTSLFGFKASSEGDGIKAFVHMQAGAKADGDGGSSTTTTVPVTGGGGGTVDVTDTTSNGRALTQRFYFGGLSGGFGKVAYGRMTNAYKFDGFKLDPFYNLAGVGAGGTIGYGGATYGLSPATNGFTDNALQYTSPAMSGVKVNVGLYVDDGANDDHGTNVGATYTAKNFNVGVQMASNDKTATVPGLVVDGDALRVHGSYKADKLFAGFSYETVDLSATTDANYMYLVGKYNVSKETQAVLTVGSVSDGAAEGSGFHAGIFQTVAPKTQLFVVHGSASLDNAATGKDPSVTSVGVIHKF